MIIYSPLAPEDIWQEQAPQFVLKECIIEGVSLQLLVAGESARVERILSTDPQVFLNSPYQPGSTISYHPGKAKP